MPAPAPPSGRSERQDQAHGRVDAAGKGVEVGGFHRLDPLPPLDRSQSSTAVKNPCPASFLWESNRPEFSFRLLIATTNRLAPNARKVIDGQEKPVGVLLRGALLR